MSVPVQYSPRIQEHIDEAQANYNRYETMLKNPADISWRLVFLFYSALHLVQAYARINTPDDIPGDHEDRNNYVAYYLPEGIAIKYSKLYIVSRQVRYGPCRFELNQILSMQAEVFAPTTKAPARARCRVAIPKQQCAKVDFHDSSIYSLSRISPMR